LGFLVALSIGAAFIAIWFVKASDLWEKSEDLWEGIFELIASLMIFFMGVTMLKMDRAKAKWRVKLQNAFNGQRASRPSPSSVVLTIHHHSQQTSTVAQKPENGYCSFSLSSPSSVRVCTRVYTSYTRRSHITLIGIEAVIFVGGVSLGQPASSIPIAAFVGLICGLICGFLVYQFASRTSTPPLASTPLPTNPFLPPS
jgi:high-affinity iron transporter